MHQPRGLVAWSIDLLVMHSGREGSSLQPTALQASTVTKKTNVPIRSPGALLPSPCTPPTLLLTNTTLLLTITTPTDLQLSEGVAREWRSTVPHQYTLREGGAGGTGRNASSLREKGLIVMTRTAAAEEEVVAVVAMEVGKCTSLARDSLPGKRTCMVVRCWLVGGTELGAVAYAVAYMA